MRIERASKSTPVSELLGMQEYSEVERWAHSVLAQLGVMKDFEKYVPVKDLSRLVKVAGLLCALHSALAPNTDSVLKRLEDEGKRLFSQRVAERKSDMDTSHKLLAYTQEGQLPITLAEIRKRVNSLYEGNAHTRFALRTAFWSVLCNFENILNTGDSHTGDAPLISPDSLDAFAHTILGPESPNDYTEWERESIAKNDDVSRIFEDSDFISIAQLLEVNFDAPLFPRRDIGH